MNLLKFELAIENKLTIDLNSFAIPISILGKKARQNGKENIDTVRILITNLGSSQIISHRKQQLTAQVLIEIRMKNRIALDDPDDETNQTLNDIVSAIVRSLYSYKLPGAATALNFDRYALFPPRQGQWLAELQFNFDFFLISKDVLPSPPITEITSTTEF